MFTAARLIAALCMAGVAYVASDYARGLYDGVEQFGLFSYINTATGFLCGWIIVGPRAGRGMSAAISNGITGTVALAFWCLMLYALKQTWELSLRRRYDGPLEAVGGVFENALDYGEPLLNTGFFMLLIIGAVVTGVLSEIAARHWR